MALLDYASSKVPEKESDLDEQLSTAFELYGDFFKESAFHAIRANAWYEYGKNISIHHLLLLSFTFRTPFNT